MILGLKLLGSNNIYYIIPLLNVILRTLKNLFIPDNNSSGALATHYLPGTPSYTTTLYYKINIDTYQLNM